jgi:hypothetical protein
MRASDAPLHDAIGVTYSGTRAEVPRIAAAIRAGLGDAASEVDLVLTGDRRDAETVGSGFKVKLLEER